VTDIRQVIEQAKEYLASDHWPYPDPNMANYVLRDTPEVQAAGLYEMTWAGHNDGSLHENDVLYLIECLEKFLDTPSV